MRPVLALKTLLRSPMKTVLTFILLGVVTFALFSRSAEYAIIKREMDAAAKQYRGVGAVELEPAAESYPDMPLYIHTDPRMAGLYDLGDASLGVQRYKLLTREQVDAISGLPYISSVSTRYMTAGISDLYPRISDSNSGQNILYYSYPEPVVFEATLYDIWYGRPMELNDYGGSQHFNRLIVEDINYLTGNTPQFRRLNMSSIFGDDKDRFMIYAGPRMNPEWGYLGVNTWMAPGSESDYTDYLFGKEFLERLTPGSRYVFITQSGFLGCYLSDRWCEPVRQIDAAPAGYIETEEFSDLKQLIEIIQADPHTFDIVYTDDMGAIMRFAEGNMAIIEGRALVPEDSESGSRVCVIDKKLAEAFRLEIGDTLYMTLGTEFFEQYKGLGAIAVTPERYEPAVLPVELEIAGIYRNVDTDREQYEKPHWSYSVNTVFVPKSLLPVDEGLLTNHLYSPAEVSFTVENVKNFEPFLTEAAPLVGEMGMTLFFSDAGWPEIEAEFREAGSMSTINITVFSGVVAAVTLFVVYLFIGRNKKEYAIMRALGTGRRASAKALLYPLMVTAFASILAGIGVSWAYTLRIIGDNEAILALGGNSVPGCYRGGADHRHVPVLPDNPAVIKGSGYYAHAGD